jgi:glycosyltransferase involved in cell wall biosynthesis
MENRKQQFGVAPDPVPSTERIRVAWLAPSLARGFYWQPVFKEFTCLFPNTVIFTSSWPGFLQGYEKAFKIQILPGFRFITLRRESTGYDRGFIWPSAAVVWELLRFRPHIIFVGGFNIWTLYAVLYKALTRCRLILLCDGISPTIAYLNSPLRLGTRRLMARFIDASVCNTREALDYLRDVLAIPQSKLLQHPYEVQEESVLSSGSDDGSAFLSFIRHPVFLYVGSIIKRKGWRSLLEAANHLAQRGLDHFSVIFVGDGEEAEELRRLMRSLGLERLVHVVGAVRYENLGAYLQSCDVFVLPTLEDIWAVVVPEAMAFGKPVLCSKYAGSKELIEPSGNGFVFDPYNPQELADFMARFIEQPNLAARFGMRSKEIISPYTPERAAHVLGSLVVKVLDGVERGQKLK